MLAAVGSDVLATHKDAPTRRKSRSCQVHKIIGRGSPHCNAQSTRQRFGAHPCPDKKQNATVCLVSCPLVVRRAHNSHGEHVKSDLQLTCRHVDLTFCCISPPVVIAWQPDAPAACYKTFAILTQCAAAVRPAHDHSNAADTSLSLHVVSCTFRFRIQW